MYIFNVKKLNENAIIPKYQTKQAAGFDFHATEAKVIMPGEIAIIGTGLAIELSPVVELQVRPRSGMSAKSKIRVANSPGTIDADYRGEIKIILDNIGTLPYTINVGDRIAQGVICPVIQASFQEVDELTDTERGAGGLGSTGV
jgi:dUTP pyrophosphatase